jgi:hypothetical protein
MSRDEQRVNGVELKPPAYRAARHRLDRLSGVTVTPPPLDDLEIGFQ